MTTRPSAPPSLDAVVGEFRLTRARTVQLTLVGSLGFLLSAVGFAVVHLLATGAEPSLVPGSFGDAWWSPLASILVVLALTTAVLVPHEWLHGLAMRYYGGTPRYGLGLAHYVLPYAYATTDEPFDRNRFLVVLLAPLVGVTIVGVPLMVAFEWGWLVLPLAANAGGAVVDLWMAATLLRYPAHVVLVDDETGTLVYGREGDRPDDHRVGTLGWDALVGGATAAAALLALGLLVGPVALSALGVEQLTLGTPGTPTFVYEFTETATETSFSFGAGLFGLSGLLGLAYAAVRLFGRRRLAASGA